jgi:predicted kinase
MIHEKKLKTLTLMVLVGNIGSGKTTMAKKLISQGYIVSSFDSIAKTLMQGDTGSIQGMQFRRLCLRTYEGLIYDSLDLGISIVADYNNLRRSSREVLCKMAKSFNASCLCIDFGAGTEEGLQRRIESSNDLSVQGYDFMYRDLMNKYQKPVVGEGFNIVLKNEDL